MSDSASRIVAMVERVLGVPIQVRVRTWDGSEAGPEGAPVLVIKSRNALRRIVFSPNSLGVARGWVSGEIDVEGDILDILDRLCCPQAIALALMPTFGHYWNCLLEIPGFLSLARPWLPPSGCPEEIQRRGWSIRSLLKDREAISHHYDVGNEFFKLIFGAAMTYSCAYFSTPETPLLEAQTKKAELICQKLYLKASQRLLDVGCGWGSISIHAAKYYGVTVVGINISEQQVDFAREWVQKLGLEKRVQIRSQDYREVSDGPFDAICCVEMAEHVGPTNMFTAFARCMFALLKPGGRFLNQQNCVHGSNPMRSNPFVKAFVFADFTEMVPVDITLRLLEEVGFEVRDLQSLREHYALTTKLWVRNMITHWDQLVQLSSYGRSRVMMAHFAIGSMAFDRNLIGVNQMIAVRRHPNGDAKMPLTRQEWLSSQPTVIANNNEGRPLD